MADEQTPQSGQPGEPSYPTYTPPTTNPAPETPEPRSEPLPPTHVPYGNKQSYSGTYPPPPGSSGGVTIIDPSLVTTRAAKGCGGLAFLIMMFTFIPVVIGIIFAIRSISGGLDLDDGLGNPFSTEKMDMRTPEAFEAFLDELREVTGSTTVFEATVYDDHLSAYVPADSSSKRYYYYYFDGGDLQKLSQSTSTYKRFDLATIDPTVLRGLFDKAETLVEQPTSTYVIIRSPEAHMNGAWFSVHANNDFMESGYVTADRTGKIVMEYLSQ